MASEEKSCQASAISSAGSPTITTGFGMLERDHPHRTADQLRPTRRANQVGTLGSTPAPSPCGDRGDTNGELADRVHEHDADMAQMLELERQFFD